MDVAKLAAYLLGSGDDLDEIWGVDVAKGERLPLVLVPTTAGTGSEATPISVITCEGGVKLAVNARPLTADWAVLDPQLTVGLPRGVTAATGIDAIVHAVEAYTSARLKNPLSDALAREALRLLTTNLLTACTEPQNLAGARGDAARRAPRGPGLLQRAGRGRARPRLPARRPSSPAAWRDQCADASARAPAQFGGRARALRRAGTDRRSGLRGGRKPGARRTR